LADKAKLLASAQKNLQKNQIAKAIKDFRGVIEIDPKDIRNRQKLAELLSRAKLNDDALQEYEAVAKYYTENGFYLKSIAVYKQMQKLDPTQVKFYHRLAELNEKQGLLGNALAEYRTLVGYYEKNQMTNEAISVLQKMKELEPENLNILVKIAEAYALTGMQDQAREEIDAVLESLTGKGDFTKVIKLCEMFQNFFPDDRLLLIRSADSLIKSGQADKGVQKLRSLSGELQNDPEVLRVLARGYDKLAQHGDETATYKQLLHSIPDDLDLQQAYVEACLKAKDFQEALDCLERWKDSFLEQSRVGLLKGFYETLRENVPQNEQVVKTLHAIYEATGDGDKLFDLMSGETGVPEVGAAAQFATLDDSLLQNTDNDLEDLSSVEEADTLDDAIADPADPVADPANEAVTPWAGVAAENETDVEVSLDFLEDAVQVESPANKMVAEDLEFDLDLDLDIEIEAADPETELEELAPEAELEEIIPEAELLENVELDVTFELEEAEFYLQQGLFDEAAAVCRKILDFEPGNSQTEEKLAEILNLGHSAKLSAEAARSKSEAGPKDRALPEEQASENAFDWEAAGTEVVELTEDDIDPEDAESHFNLGIAYKEMGLLSDAINEFAEAMRHHSRRFDALILKGVCLAEKGSVVEAEEVLSQGLVLSGLNATERVSLNFELALLKEAGGDLEAALGYYLEAAKVDHFFRDVGIKIKQLKEALGISDAGLDESLSPLRNKNKVSYL
jgi:tetratricopeptide (TPR) repeat protein